MSQPCVTKATSYGEGFVRFLDKCMLWKLPLLFSKYIIFITHMTGCFCCQCSYICELPDPDLDADICWSINKCGRMVVQTGHQVRATCDRGFIKYIPASIPLRMLHQIHNVSESTGFHSGHSLPWVRLRGVNRVKIARYHRLPYSPVI